MTASLLLPLIGLVFASAGTVLLAIAFVPSSDVHQAGGRSLVVQGPRWLIPGGLGAVIIGFVFQAAGILCEALR